RAALADRVEADVGAREERAQARDLPARHARADDPEPRPLAQVRLGALHHARADLDVRELRREDDLLHEADLDVLVPDLRLAGLEPVGVLEADRDLRAALRERAPGDEGAD